MFSVEVDIGIVFINVFWIREKLNVLLEGVMTDERSRYSHNNPPPFFFYKIWEIPKLFEISGIIHDFFIYRIMLGIQTM